MPILSPVNEGLNLDTISYKRSLVIGTLLGDAHSRRRDTKRTRKTEFFVTHSLQQADLVEWKAAEFRRLYRVAAKVHYDLPRNRVNFYLSQGKRLRVMHDWFHRGKQKIISDKIRFMDHPIGLSMLLCDDGSIRKRKKFHKDGSIYFLSPSITIATHSFDEQSVENLLCHIESVCGAVGYINPERRIRAGKKMAYCRTNFNADNSKKLWQYVQGWIPQVPSMLSKFSFAIERYGIG
jgi:hypothetical protein